MKVLKKLFVLLSISALMVACDETQVYQSWQDIAQLRWERSNVIENKVNIEDNSKQYKITLGLRYIPGIPEKEVKVLISIINLNGESQEIPYTVKLKDDNDEHLGEVMGELADITQVIEENYSFSEAGEYTFLIVQAMPQETLGGVLEVGLILNTKPQ